MRLFKKKKNAPEPATEEKEEVIEKTEDEIDVSDSEETDPSIQLDANNTPSSVKPGIETNDVPETIERFLPDVSQGLTSEQVSLRKEQELTNKEKSKTTTENEQDTLLFPQSHRGSRPLFVYGQRPCHVERR